MGELPPLLRLPPSLRRRIYGFVGLTASSITPGTLGRFDLHGGLVDPYAPSATASTFHGLLLSCRTIHAEAAAIVYSCNGFILRYDPANPEPLRPLHALTATALASLTSLTIILNQASCHQIGYTDLGYCCVEGRDDKWSGLTECEFKHGDLHQSPLLAHGDNDFAAAQHLLAEWSLAAARLSSVPAGRLELALVCDIDPSHKRALEVASLVTAPLRLLPQLRDCRIRLCKIPDARLQQIAWDSVLQARHTAAPPYYSPMPSARTKATLVGLPRELRLRILEHTDLIAPGREVTWSRQDQGYLTVARGDYFEEDDLRVFFHCWNSSESFPFFHGCFCRRRHAAFSSACKCWAPPGPLFLVCRTLYQDAQFTFFSGNRFIVHDYKTSRCWALPGFREWSNENLEQPEWSQEPEETYTVSPYSYPESRFAASQFLREVVPAHCLAYLRFLELVFPPYLAQTWPRGDHPVLQDWQATVDWLLDKVDAPALTLRLAGAEVHYESPSEYHEIIPKSEGDDIAKAHLDLTRPLKALADVGLARFFFRFPCPWEFTMDCLRRSEMRSQIEAKQRRDKASFERMVLGERYKHQYADGREEPGPSYWVLAYDRL
ncbi:hypothetical protein NEMBOFW57_006323 [Staphylotrichum longicolle]|uniref:F-box domain-containing protein n=1 Tax=Staphylotrichum longicolle TaxID=669026 RepID=A0AAD4EYI5_9PEZI|nr:hypothetical protein NEMBOFW57_006323 [Staphylotrichum longicolle]